MKVTLIRKEDLKHPISRFYIVNTHGDYIFLDTDSHEHAVEFSRSVYPRSEVKSSILAHKESFNDC